MPLEPQTHPPRTRPWVIAHWAGVLCATLGLAAFALTAWIHFHGGHGVSDLPAPGLPIVFLVATVPIGLLSLVRAEGAWLLPIVGVALSASALIVGIALVVWAIALVALVIVLLLSEIL